MTEWLVSSMVTLAATAAPAGAPAGTPTGTPPPGWFQFLQGLGPLLVILIIFYVMVMGTKRRQDRERRQMLESLKKNDRVRTIGGMFGTVLEVKDDAVVLKIDESANVKARFARDAVATVLSDTDTKK